MRHKRRREDEDKSSRRKKALREIEDKEWEQERRGVDESAGNEDDLAAWPDESEVSEDVDWTS